jgi:NADH-quinone oxidoreductase subunit L
MPVWLGGYNALQAFLDTALPQLEMTSKYAHFADGTGGASVTILIVAVGIGIAWLLWIPWRKSTHAFSESPAIRPLAAYWLGGWGFDWLYDLIFVRPVKWFARAARNDLVDYVVGGIAWLNVAAWRTLSAGQTGRLRAYVAVAGFGIALVLAVVVLR